MTLKLNKMKKIVFVFLLFSTIAFAQKQQQHHSNDDLPSSFDPNEIVKKVKDIVDLTPDQEERMSQHLKRRKEFFAAVQLSDSRKQTVLNAYKEEFDNILNAKQATLINKKNESLYIYITTKY